ncbi:hypothetical protein [uncultured Winogradskyella sp.]|uniref:toxin-antitoxin system YwqK family antitoxin n=1 Tax=uncultured Winogradskyella sp. TaxID=395353 RepID=UPI003512C7E4
MNKKFYSLLLIFAVPFFCLGQEAWDYVEYYEGTDVLWRKGKVLNEKPHGYWEYYNKEGVLSSTGFWIEGAKDSVWKGYVGGKLWYIENFKNDKRNGVYIQMDLYSSGYAEFKGEYEDDIPIGKWTSYYTRDERVGKVANEFDFEAIGKTSPITSYSYGTDYKDINGKDPYYSYPFKGEGTIKFTSKENNPMECGMSFVWFLYLNLEINAVYHGNWKYYYQNGQVYAEGSYENGFKQGNWTYYYPNGNKWMVCHFYGGCKRWEEETGPNVTTTYERNFRSGPFELYYENGKLKEKGEYTNEEEKTGVWKYYNEDGSLKESIDYSR